MAGGREVLGALGFELGGVVFGYDDMVGGFLVRELKRCCRVVKGGRCQMDD
jgi:hypothetical protein